MRWWGLWRFLIEYFAGGPLINPLEESLHDDNWLIAPFLPTPSS